MPTLTLLLTGDLHGRLEQMTRLATVIQQQRFQAQAEGRPVRLLDAGDSASTNVWESAVTEGRANQVLLEAMGYDAAALGNSDSQWGSAALKRLLAAVHFPLLAANLRVAGSDSPLNGLGSYTLFRYDAFTAAVVGLATGLRTHADFQLADPVQTLRPLIPQLRNEGASLIVVLSHLGIDVDRQLAAAVPGVHLIVGGHTHTTLIQPEFVAGAAIVHTGEFGNYLGRIDIELDPNSGSVGIRQYELIAVTPKTPPDPTVSGMLELVQFEAAVARKKGASSNNASGHPHTSPGH